MYQTNSGLEQRICTSYQPTIVGTPLPNPTISYSKLEVACSPAKPEYVITEHPTGLMQNQVIGYADKKQGYLNKKQTYLQGKKKQGDYKLNNQTKMRFNPDNFINPDAPACQFIGKAFEIQGLVEEAFLKTTGTFLPKDITIEILSKENMQKTTAWQDGTVGFCLNRKGFGVSNIFVMQGSLDRVMLTIGHEIGHCLSLPLNDIRGEEAKAFAFSLAWMKTIKENNIGNLAANILPNPAKNGLHNIAFDFVINLIEKGRNALDVFMDLMKRKLRFGGEIENAM